MLALTVKFSLNPAGTAHLTHAFALATATLNELLLEPNLQVITGKSERSWSKQTDIIRSELLETTFGEIEVIFGGAITV
jgi:hypothetical protein